MGEWEALLGDAVHAMSPTGGIGAVTALRGAECLVSSLSDGDGGVGVESVKKFEDEMREIASLAIRQSFFGGKLLFGMKAYEELEQ
jgi:2-polyprenyl-6-methoxyphenol hydroxylase-like FAD-dependent oxidoreductase